MSTVHLFPFCPTATTTTTIRLIRRFPAILSSNAFKLFTRVCKGRCVLQLALPNHSRLCCCCFCTCRKFIVNDSMCSAISRSLPLSLFLFLGCMFLSLSLVKVCISSDDLLSRCKDNGFHLILFSSSSSRNVESVCRKGALVLPAERSRLGPDVRLSVSFPFGFEGNRTSVSEDVPSSGFFLLFFARISSFFYIGITMHFYMIFYTISTI